MRSIFVASLALVAAILGGAIGAIFAALLAGRLDLFRNRPGHTFFFIWGVRSDTSAGGILWEAVGALVRAICAFAAARLVLVLLSVRPTLTLAAALVVALLAWDLRHGAVHRRALIPVPQEIRSLHTLQIIARVLASVVVAPFFLRL